MGDNPRIAIEFAAGNATIRAMFQHPMETGRRRDDHGELVPALYIAEVTCEFRGQIVLSADWSTGIARNPALTLELQKVHRGEVVKISWRDNSGTQGGTEIRIR